MPTSPDFVKTKMRELLSRILETWNGEALAPVVFLVKDGEMVRGLELHPWSDDTKLYLIQEVVQLARRAQADALIFISDAWVSATGLGRPSSAPDRQEALQALGVCREHRPVSLLQPYQRAGERISPGEAITMAHSDSWLVELLTHAIRPRDSSD